MNIPIDSDPSVVPEGITPDDAKGSKGSAYVCLNCQAEKTGPKNLLNWVLCPIYADLICEGCCIDISTVCRREGKDYRENEILLTDEVSPRSGRSVDELRLICLQHQVEILEIRLQRKEFGGDWRLVRTGQLEKVSALLEDLLEEPRNSS